MGEYRGLAYNTIQVHREMYHQYKSKNNIWILKQKHSHHFQTSAEFEKLKRWLQFESNISQVKMTRYYTGNKKTFSEKIELEYYPLSGKTVLRMVSAIEFPRGYYTSIFDIQKYR